MVVDGDVEELPNGPAGVIALAVAGDAMAWAHDAGELLDVEMDELAGVCALVAADRRRWRESRELVGVAVEEARDRGFGELDGTGDLEAWELAAAQRQNPRSLSRKYGRRFTK